MKADVHREWDIIAAVLGESEGNIAIGLSHYSHGGVKTNGYSCECMQLCTCVCVIL